MSYELFNNTMGGILVDSRVLDRETEAEAVVEIDPANVLIKYKAVSFVMPFTELEAIYLKAKAIRDEATKDIKIAEPRISQMFMCR